MLLPNEMLSIYRLYNKGYFRISFHISVPQIPAMMDNNIHVNPQSCFWSLKMSCFIRSPTVVWG